MLSVPPLKEENVAALNAALLFPASSAHIRQWRWQLRQRTGNFEQNCGDRTAIDAAKKTPQIINKPETSPMP